MTTWQVAVRRVSTVRGFGGTGFAAKELALDAACGHDLSQAADFNSWCPVGPGARREVTRAEAAMVQELAAMLRGGAWDESARERGLSGSDGAQ